MGTGKFLFLLLVSVIAGCTNNNLPVVSGSIAYDGNKGWIYLRIYNAQYQHITDATCILDSFFKVSFQEPLQSYYREVSSVTPHSHHSIQITDGFSAVAGSTTVPSDFSILNIDTDIIAGESLYVSWRLNDTREKPEEWYITITHNNVQYFNISLLPDTTSTTIDGGNFPAPGIYELSIYGIIYGGLENVDTQSAFAGITQRKIIINVRSK